MALSKNPTWAERRMLGEEGAPTGPLRPWAEHEGHHREELGGVGAYCNTCGVGLGPSVLPPPVPTPEEVIAHNDSRAALKLAAVCALEALTDEERAETFGGFCTHCGSDDPSCRCWDDE